MITGVTNFQLGGALVALSGGAAAALSQAPGGVAAAPNRFGALVLGPRGPVVMGGIDHAALVSVVPAALSSGNGANVTGGLR